MYVSFGFSTHVDDEDASLVGSWILFMGMSPMLTRVTMTTHENRR